MVARAPRFCAKFLKFNLFSAVRCYSLTGNLRTNSEVHSLMGGRVESWMAKYENLVGLKEVKDAQSKVIEAEHAFQNVQTLRRQRQQEMISVQNKLKEIHAQLDKVQRGDERYLSLLTEEYEVMKDEKKIMIDLGNCEQHERDHFAALSSAVRESHERERARAERTKYWSVIGSIIGATIGIVGTSINNYLRMRELKGMVKESTEGGFEMKDIVGKLLESMTTQYNQIQGLISELKIFAKPLGDVSDGHVLQLLPENSALHHSQVNAHFEARTNEILEFLKTQDKMLNTEVKEIKKLLALNFASDQEKPIVYIGPEIESLLTQTEAKIEWKMKLSAILTTAFVYGACAITLSVLYNILKGGSG